MGPFNFFATGQGVLLLGLMAGLIVLLWDWRVALISLVVIQVGVAVLLTQVQEVSGQTMFVQTLIMALCATMIATAGLQVQLRRSGRQSGGWLFRLLVLFLLGVALYWLDLSLFLPEIAPAISRIFGWIALIALIMLSLGDNPVFTITALLIWCALGQALATIYAPAPEVMVAIGVMELVLGLTASYLLLAERLPQLAQASAARRNAATYAAMIAPAGQTQQSRRPALLRRAPTQNSTQPPMQQPSQPVNPPVPPQGQTPSQPPPASPADPKSGTPRA